MHDRDDTRRVKRNGMAGAQRRHIARWSGVGLAALLLSLSVVAARRPTAVRAEITPPAETFAGDARDAVTTLERRWFTGERWRMCLIAGCATTNQDWGADALTDDLYLHWRRTADDGVVAIMRALVASAPAYGAPCERLPCAQWSDVPLWDAVADLREHAATGGARDALRKAERAFDAVDRARVYALGACPEIRYQQPGGGRNRLKTLETDANYVKAALLLHRATHRAAYLEKARASYAAIRARYLDPRVPLYTVYVFDDGEGCTPLPHRFFASVNGLMIWNGIALAQATGKRSYLNDAIATARAVDAHLSDSRGIYADLQAENDVAEPLVEAMLRLARERREPFARAWILRNAGAARSARTDDGFGRFFDGPPPRGPITAWQTNGGVALMIAAAALRDDAARAADRPRSGDAWASARYVAREIVTLPASIAFTGSGIALFGTIGARCCELGHARVFIDGRETLDRTGIWQNKSSAGIPLPDSVLFAWRWPTSGRHRVTIRPAAWNAKEGGSFLHLGGEAVLGSR